MQNKFLRKLQRPLSLMLTLAMLVSSFAITGLTLPTFAAEETEFYVTTDSTFDPSKNDGEIVKKDGTYVWKFPTGESGKYFGIADPDGILNESTHVIYEYEILMDTDEGNDRCFLGYGSNEYGYTGVKDDQTAPNRNGYAAHGGWLPTPAKHEWGTITMDNTDFDPNAQGANNAITRLGSWFDPGKTGTLYVRSVKVYDAVDKSKEVYLTFKELPENDPEALKKYAEYDFENSKNVNAAIDYNQTKQDIEDRAPELLQEWREGYAANLTPEGDDKAANDDQKRAVGYEARGLKTVAGVDTVEEQTGYILWAQNRGFAIKPNNVKTWLKEGQKVKAEVTYYFSTASQGNTRLNWQVAGDNNWTVIRGDSAQVKVGEVQTVTLELDDTQSANILNGSTFKFMFHNYNDNPAKSTDMVVLKDVKLIPVVEDETDPTDPTDPTEPDETEPTTQPTEPTPTEPTEPTQPTDPNGKADLIVESISATSTKVGDLAKFEAVIKNIGTAPVKAGEKFGIVYRVKNGNDTVAVLWYDGWKNDGSIDKDIPVGGTVTVPVTIGGNENLGNNDGTWRVVAGTYTVEVEVNDNRGAEGCLQESDYDNNTNSFPLTITAPVYSGNFDLVVTDIAVTTTEVGQPAKFIATIKNVGRGPVPADLSLYGVKFTIKAADGSTATVWSDEWKQTPYGDALEAGATLVLPQSNGGQDNGDGSWTVVEGDFTVEAWVNDNDIAGQGIPGETDRSNNKLTKTFTGIDKDSKRDVMNLLDPNETEKPYSFEAHSNYVELELGKDSVVIDLTNYKNLNNSDETFQMNTAGTYVLTFDYYVKIVSDNDTEVVNGDTDAKGRQYVLGKNETITFTLTGDGVTASTQVTARMGEVASGAIEFTIPEGTDLSTLKLTASGNILDGSHDANVTSLKLSATNEKRYVVYKAQPDVAEFNLKVFDYLPNGFLFEPYNTWDYGDYFTLWGDTNSFLEKYLVDGHPVYAKAAVDQVFNSFKKSDGTVTNGDKWNVVSVDPNASTDAKKAYEQGKAAQNALRDAVHNARFNGGREGSYDETLAKVGTWGKPMHFFKVDGDDTPYAETLYDFAYCMLNNLFVEDSQYNLLVKDLNKLQLQATSDEYFSFDSGWDLTVEDGVIKNTSIISPYYTELHWTSFDGYNAWRAKKQFFALDGYGFEDRLNNVNGEAHNYSYAIAGDGLFVYEEGMNFQFTGDDDLMVYINGKLEMNLCGLNDRTAKTLNLDTLGLEVGHAYPIQFFYMERRTDDSNMKMVSSISAGPSTIDVKKNAYRNEKYENGFRDNADTCEANTDVFYQFVIGAKEKGQPLENFIIADEQLGLTLDHIDGLTWAEGKEALHCSENGLTVQKVKSTKDGYQVLEYDLNSKQDGFNEKLVEFLTKGIDPDNNELILVRGLKKTITEDFENRVSVTATSDGAEQKGTDTMTLRVHAQAQTFAVDYNMPLNVTWAEAFDGYVPDSVKVEKAEGLYGTVTVNNDTKTITYTLNKEMRGADRFFFEISVGTGDVRGIPIVFVPANNVFYSPSIVFDKANWNSTYDDNAWTTEDNADVSLNHSDRSPKYGYGGNTGLENVNRELGKVYKNVNMNGTSLKFSFQGTMVDVYARTTSETGVVRAILRDKNGKALQMQIVDTEYHSNGTEGFFEIPVIHFDCTDYNDGYAAEYTVDLYVVAKGTATAKDRGLFVFDGIRVYNPTWGVNDGDVFNRFNKDAELGSKFIQLRQVMLNKIDMGGNGKSAVYFIDYKVKGENQHEFGIDEYTNYGPKNEVYLYQNQSITFTVPQGVNVHLGAKSPAGKPVEFTVTGVSGETTVYEKTFKVSSTMDMYYKIGNTADTAVTYTITCNSGENVLALTNLKLTTAAEAKQAQVAELDLDLLYSAHTANVALMMLNGDIDGAIAEQKVIVAEDNTILPSTNESLATMGGVRGEREEMVAD